VQRTPPLIHNLSRVWEVAPNGARVEVTAAALAGENGDGGGEGSRRRWLRRPRMPPTVAVVRIS